MYKVMLVDDIEVMRRQIKRLDLWGEQTGFYIVDEADDGFEALSKLEKNPVDLLITDISMPRINGIELLKEVYEQSLATCVVFLSEHKEFSYAKEAIQYDIFDYLVKPVEREELRALLIKVKRFIEQKRALENEKKELENKLVERLDLFYPINQINDVINCVIGGDEAVSERIAEMVGITFKALEYDLVKTALVLQKTYTEILNAVKTKYAWIDQFADTTAFTCVDLTKLKHIDEIEGQLSELVESLAKMINKFILVSKKSSLVAEICDFIIRNVDHGITLSKVSEGLFLTKNHIGDVFKQETGLTVGEYIIMVKVERAKQLIKEGNLKQYEISELLGYNDSEYFAKLFKKNTGLSPIAYKASLIEKK